MNQDIYSMTPGSAVADSLQEILMRKKLEARQAMLDSLNEENVHSEIQSRADQADTNRMYRTAYTDQRNANIGKIQREADDEKRAREGMHNFVTGPSFAGLDDKLKPQFQLADQTGDTALFKTLLTNMGKGKEGGPILINGPHGLTETSYWNNAGPQVVNQNYPPVQPADTYGETIIATGPDGLNHGFTYNRRNAKVQELNLPEGYTVKGGLSSLTKPPIEYKPKITTKDQADYSNLVKASADTGGFMVSDKVKQAKVAKAQFEQSIKRKFDPKLVMLVEGNATQPENVYQLTQQALESGDITEQEAPAFSELLQFFKKSAPPPPKVK